MSGIFSPTVPKRNNPYDSICEWIRGTVNKLNSQRSCTPLPTCERVVSHVAFVAAEPCVVESISFSCAKPAEVATSVTVLKSVGGVGVPLHAAGSINACSEAMSLQQVQLTSDDAARTLATGDSLVLSYSSENSGRGTVHVVTKRA